MRDSPADTRGGRQPARTPGVILLPVLVAVVYPLNLYALNLGDVNPADVTRSVVALALAALAVTALCWVLFGSLPKGALMASAVLVVVLSYGHVFGMIQHLDLAGFSIGRHRYLIGASLIALGLTAVALRRTARVSPAVLAGLGMALLVMVAGPAIRILRYASTSVDRIAAPQPSTPAPPRTDLPDIYYIVPDTHARADTLLETYGYDAAAFLDGLRARGFYVADRSLSNYASTDLSLASSLNMTYLTALAESLGPGSEDLTPAERMIQDNAVIDLAHRLGYTVITYESEAPFIRFDKADEVYAPDLDEGPTERRLAPGVGVNPYESLLLETTAARALFDLGLVSRGELANASFWEHRKMLLFPLQHVRKVASRDEPTLVLLHLMAPHPPFVFGPDGEEVNDDRRFTLGDIGCCSAEEYITGYRDQAAYVDQLLLETVDGILAASDEPPVILLQGDTGPSSNLTWTDATPEAVRERMRILNAYLLPPACLTSPYPTITPVNSFRLVFGGCLGLEMGLLPDQSFYSTYLKPYDFELITDVP